MLSTSKSTEKPSEGSADAAFACIERCCRDMLAHDGYGEMRIESRILKRGQKEIIVHFGRQYRFVVDAE